jgi:hypothetical protein
MGIDTVILDAETTHLGAVESWNRRKNAQQCKNGYEHHAARNPSQSAAILAEAFGTYLGREGYQRS